MSKRGHAHKVEEKWTTKCNQEGMSPVLSEVRFNLRTMSARIKNKLEMRADEMHAWALKRSNDKVVGLETQLQEETYQHLVEKEACVMRANKQKRKDKEYLAQAEERHTRLQGLFVAAEVASKQLERKLRVETIEGSKVWDQLQTAETMVADLEEQFTANLQKSRVEVAFLQEKLKAKCDEVKSKANHVDDLEKRLRDLEGNMARVEAKCNRVEKRLSATNVTIAALKIERAELRKVCHLHNVICVLLFLFCFPFISNKEMKQQQEERQNTNNIMETKVLGQQRNLAASEAKYKNLEGHEILVQVQEDLEEKLDEEEVRVQEVCHIRHTEQRFLFPLSCLVLDSYVFPFLVAFTAGTNDSDLKSGFVVSAANTTRHGNTFVIKRRPVLVVGFSKLHFMYEFFIRSILCLYT
jgi:hypothetical protein